MVEIKARAAVPHRGGGAAGARGAPGRPASLISFDEAAIEEVARAGSGAADRLSAGAIQPFEPRCAGPWSTATPPSYTATATWGWIRPRRWRRRLAYGRQIGCYVVNDPDRMKQLAVFGLWGFVTDVPDVARGCLVPASDDRR